MHACNFSKGMSDRTQLTLNVTLISNLLRMHYYNQLSASLFPYLNCIYNFAPSIVQSALRNRPYYFYTYICEQSSAYHHYQ